MHQDDMIAGAAGVNDIHGLDDIYGLDQRRSLDRGVHADAVPHPALAEHVAEIRRLGKRAVEDVIEIGRRLTLCKEIVGFGNWLAWLQLEFGWSEATARNFMRVHELVQSKCANFADLNLPVSTLYLLAAPSTPDPVRDEVLERAAAGEHVSPAQVKEMKAEAKRTETRTPELGNGKNPAGDNVVHLRDQEYTGLLDDRGDIVVARHDGDELVDHQHGDGNHGDVGAHRDGDGVHDRAVEPVEADNTDTTPVEIDPATTAATALAALTDDALIEVLRPYIERVGREGLGRAMSDKLKADFRDHIIGLALTTASTRTGFAQASTGRLHVMLRCAEQSEPSAEDIRNMIAAGRAIVHVAEKRGIARSNVLMTEGEAKKPKHKSRRN
jgi:hypothetical protein